MCNKSQGFYGTNNNTLNIVHYSCRPIHYSGYNESYLNLNLVFKCFDSFYDGILLKQTAMFVDVPVITDLEKWEYYYHNREYQWDDDKKAYCMINDFPYDEISFMSRGHIINDYFLDFIEKFNVYRFSCTIKTNTATKGLIKYLEELCTTKDLNVTQFYDLLTTLKALHDFS